MGAVWTRRWRTSSRDRTKNSDYVGSSARFALAARSSRLVEAWHAADPGKDRKNRKRCQEDFSPPLRVIQVGDDESHLRAPLCGLCANPTDPAHDVEVIFLTRMALPLVW